MDMKKCGNDLWKILEVLQMGAPRVLVYPGGKAFENSPANSNGSTLLGCAECLEESTRDSL